MWGFRPDIDNGIISVRKSGQPRQSGRRPNAMTRAEAEEYIKNLSLGQKSILCELIKSILRKNQQALTPLDPTGKED